MIFKPSSPLAIARVELQQSEIALLEAQKHCEYYSAVREMYIQRINRLKSYVEQGEAPTANMRDTQS